MQNQLEEVIRENKKFYELKNSDNKNSGPIATTTKEKCKGNIQTAQQSLLGTPF